MKIILNNTEMVFGSKPKTAEEFVELYAAKATISSGNKTTLTSFIQSLMDGNLWSAVSHFFPMLGGMDGYKYEINPSVKQTEWAAVNGTYWDSTKNSIKADTSRALAGEGTPILLNDFDWHNGTILYGVAPVPTNILITSAVESTSQHNAYFGDIVDYGLSIKPVSYGNGVPAFGTPRGIFGYNNTSIWETTAGWNVANFTGEIFGMSLKSKAEGALLFVKPYNNDTLYKGSQILNDEEMACNKLKVILGYNHTSADAGKDYNIHFLMTFNRSLTSSEMETVIGLLKQLQVDLGRGVTN